MTTYTLQIDVVGRDKASGPLSRVSSALGGMGTIAGGILTAGIFQAVGRGIIGAGQAALRSTGNYERMSQSLQTLVARELKNSGATDNMTDALAMASDRASELLAWTQQLAIQSPFDQKGVSDAFSTAMAYGFTADEAQRLTQATIDYAAGAGKGSDAMNRISLALGQIKAKGKLAGQEVLQLVNAGVSVDQILADAMGKSTEEIVAMREKGLIPANDAIEMITQSLEDDFGGAAARQSDTWSGLMNTFADIKEIGLREFFSGALTALKPLVTHFSAWMQDKGIERLREMGDSLGSFVSNLLDAGPRIKDTLSDLFSGIDLSGFQSFFTSVGGNIGASFGNMFSGIQENISGLLSNIIPWLMDSFEKISDWFGENKFLIAAFARTMSDAFVNVSATIAAAWGWIQPILSGIIDLALGLAKTIMQVATGNWAGAWETMKGTLVDVGAAINDAFDAFIEWMLNLMGSSTEELVAIWQGNWNQFLQIATNLLGTILSIILEKVDAIKGFISERLTDMKTLWNLSWSDMADVIRNNWDDWTGLVAEKTAEIKATIKEKTQEWVDTIGSFASNFFEEGSNILTQLAKGLWAGVQTALDAIVEIGGMLVTAWKSATKGLGSWSISAPNAIGSIGVGGAAGGAGGVGGGYQPPPEAANGGILSGSTSGFPALLHGTEAVVPLPDGHTIPVSLQGNGGGNTVVHVTINGNDPQAIWREFERRLRLQGVTF